MQEVCWGTRPGSMVNPPSKASLTAAQRNVGPDSLPMFCKAELELPMHCRDRKK